MSKPSPIELLVMEKAGKRIAEVFPHGVSIGCFPDYQESPMPWVVKVYNADGDTIHAARGFTLPGALLEAMGYA